jgi:hypothetical protein
MNPPAAVLSDCRYRIAADVKIITTDVNNRGPYRSASLPKAGLMPRLRRRAPHASKAPCGVRVYCTKNRAVIQPKKIGRLSGSLRDLQVGVSDLQGRMKEVDKVD